MTTIAAGAARPRVGALLAALLLLSGSGAGALVLATAAPAEPPGPAARDVAVVPALAAAPEVAAASAARPPATVLGPDGQVLVREEGDLREGTRGQRTLALQQALDHLGFEPGPADGVFRHETTMAVWAFQALAGAAKDGVVTDDLEARVLAGAPIAMLRPDLGPTHTEVDLTRQVLLVWGDGRLELATHVSTGSEVPYCENGACGDAVTPLGEFRYEYRIPGERHAQLGVLYDPVYFDFDGHAVHGDPAVPDRPASHGCVRIPMHISPAFPGLVEDGEVIALFRS